MFQDLQKRKELSEKYQAGQNAVDRMLWEVGEFVFVIEDFEKDPKLNKYDGFMLAIRMVNVQAELLQNRLFQVKDALSEQDAERARILTQSASNKFDDLQRNVLDLIKIAFSLKTRLQLMQEQDIYKTLDNIQNKLATA